MVGRVGGTPRERGIRVGAPGLLIPPNYVRVVCCVLCVVGRIKYGLAVNVILSRYPFSHTEVVCWYAGLILSVLGGSRRRGMYIFLTTPPKVDKAEQRNVTPDDHSVLGRGEKGGGGRTGGRDENLLAQKVNGENRRMMLYCQVVYSILKVVLDTPCCVLYECLGL